MIERSDFKGYQDLAAGVEIKALRSQLEQSLLDDSELEQTVVDTFTKGHVPNRFLKGSRAVS